MAAVKDSLEIVSRLWGFHRESPPIKAYFGHLSPKPSYWLVTTRMTRNIFGRKSWPKPLWREAAESSRVALEQISLQEAERFGEMFRQKSRWICRKCHVLLKFVRDDSVVDIVPVSYHIFKDRMVASGFIHLYLYHVISCFFWCLTSYPAIMKYYYQTTSPWKPFRWWVGICHGTLHKHGWFKARSDHLSSHGGWRVRCYPNYFDLTRRHPLHAG